ncbi:hypothetical protein [Peribacillus sp. SCS-155]|uniref:hypothetical protein n=1 Tax=Peribacillus sedimenti TaxID=3115297 RepID=UPI003905F5EE
MAIVFQSISFGFNALRKGLVKLENLTATSDFVLADSTYVFLTKGTLVTNRWT